MQNDPRKALSYALEKYPQRVEMVPVEELVTDSARQNAKRPAYVTLSVPDEVVKTVEKIWAENISKSEALKKYAASRGALFAPLYGDAAQKAVFPAVQANAWLLFDGGKAKVSPDTVGIPKP